MTCPHCNKPFTANPKTVLRHGKQTYYGRDCARRSPIGGKEEEMRDLNNFFTAIELRCWVRTVPIEDDVYEHMVRHYNKIISEYIKEQPMVYSRSDNVLWVKTHSQNDTHRAHLCCVEEIK